MNEVDREAMCRELFGLLWRFFHARVDSDVDDLIQQSLVCYFESAGRAGPVQHPKAYALRIARSVLFEHYQRRVAFDPITHRLVDVAGGLSSRLAAQERAHRLREAMLHLPYAYFEVIDLYYGEGLRGPVLAEALGVPEGTVRSRLRRAKDQLRAVYGDTIDGATLAAE
jgi:RNA polymerase sigma factor (sigma-70 family)